MSPLCPQPSHTNFEIPYPTEEFPLPPRHLPVNQLQLEFEIEHLKKSNAPLYRRLPKPIIAEDFFPSKWWESLENRGFYVNYGESAAEDKQEPLWGRWDRENLDIEEWRITLSHVAVPFHAIGGIRSKMQLYWMAENISLGRAFRLLGMPPGAQIYYHSSAAVRTGWHLEEENRLLAPFQGHIIDLETIRPLVRVVSNRLHASPKERAEAFDDSSAEGRYWRQCHEEMINAIRPVCSPPASLTPKVTILDQKHISKNELYWSISHFRVSIAEEASNIEEKILAAEAYMAIDADHRSIDAKLKKLPFRYALPCVDMRGNISSESYIQLTSEQFFGSVLEEKGQNHRTRIRKAFEEKWRQGCFEATVLSQALRFKRQKLAPVAAKGKSCA